MRTNTASNFSPRTHEGARSRVLKPFDELRRTASACLLFEDTFYESGIDIAERIRVLVHTSPLIDVLHLAQKLRHEDGLRHAPLWMLNAALGHPQRNMGDNSRLISTVIANVCGSRADLPGELIAMYFKNGKKPLAKALKRGLADAITSFSSYALQKYAARGPWRLRDVLFMVHPKPRDELQADWFKKLADDTLGEAGTWENKLSAGQDKKTAFTELLADNKLGTLAMLRNLRNMREAGIADGYMRDKLFQSVQKSRFPILPFQFIAASRAVPHWEPMIEQAMLAALMGKDGTPQLKGRTLLLVDRSGSMQDKLSTKSTLNRFDAACALAILLREICDDVDVFDYGNDLKPVPPRRGFALRDAIRPPSGGTMTGMCTIQAITYNCAHGRHPDRVIVITDEQSRDQLPKLQNGCRGYVMNVAPYQNGIAWGEWTTVSGFSENLVKFIAEVERENEGA